MLDFLIATGEEFVRLRDNGAWHAAQRALEGSRAHALWRSDEAIWVSTLGEGLWVSRDGGTRWSNYSPPLPASCVWSFAIGAPRLGNVIAPETVFAGGDDGVLVVTRDGGKRWDWLDNLWLLPSSGSWKQPRVQAMAPHPLHPDWLLVSLRGAGVLFSSDGGFSWDDARENAGHDVRELFWHRGALECALALSPDGISFSSDGGWTWTRSRFAFPGVLHTATFDVHHNNWLLLTRGQRSQLWQGEGDDWCEIALPNVEASRAFCVTTRGAHWAVGWENGAIYQSEAQGRHWQKLTLDGAAPTSLRALLFEETPLILDEN